MSDANHTDILLEDINSKFDAVIEAVGQINEQIKVLPTMQSDLQEVKADVKTIKTVLRDQSGQLDDHERRITTLEAV